MPTRYLKPGICDSDHIDLLSPLAENFYYRLLVNVDDYGRFDARPAILKARCFPLKDDITRDHIVGFLRELIQAELIIVFSDEKHQILQFLRWTNDPRAKESKYQGFTDSCIKLYTDAYECIQMHTDVNDPRTVLPGTGTGTGTGTGEPKPQTETSDIFATLKYRCANSQNVEPENPQKNTNEQQIGTGNSVVVLMPQNQRSGSKQQPELVTHQSPPQEARSSSPDEGFDEFWLNFPKHVNRKGSLQLWRSKHLANIADKIIIDVCWRKENDYLWLQGFIPNPTTYLRQERWHDDQITRAQAIRRGLIAGSRLQQHSSDTPRF